MTLITGGYLKDPIMLSFYKITIKYNNAGACDGMMEPTLGIAIYQLAKACI